MVGVLGVKTRSFLSLPAVVVLGPDTLLLSDTTVPRYAPIRPLWRAYARLQRTSADTFVTPAGAGGRRSTRRQEEQDGPQRWFRAATPHRTWVVQPYRTSTPRSCACVACHSARNLAPPKRAFRGRAWRMLASRFGILASNGRL